MRLIGHRAYALWVVSGLVSPVVLLAIPPKPILDRLGNATPILVPDNSLTQGVGHPITTAGGAFDSLNVVRLSQVKPQAFSTNATCSVSATNVCANDVWGFVSESGREYAIMGLRTGTGFVDVTDPVNPVVVGAIADANSVWSDIRTYNNFAYNVNESGGGLQVIDLKRLDPPTRQVTLVRSVTQSGLSTVHNLTLNVESGFLYLCGANLGGGRLVAMSLSSPANPVIVGQMNDATYVHDAQVVNYSEGAYAGREIAFCFCGGSGLKIVDVTDKSNMFTLATLFYPNVTYCHQGGLSEDRRYLFVDDELDELNRPGVTTTTTYVVDVQDLSDPQFVTSFTSGMPSIDHNLFVRGHYVFEGNYTSGLRIFDVADVFNVVQVGWFDSYTYNNSASFDGVWGNYPYLPSGNVLISDMQGGLFVLDASAAVGSSCAPVSAPLSEPDAILRNRYLSVTPSNSNRQTALRVRLADLPPPFEDLNGSTKWVDLPEDVVDRIDPVTTIKRSRLACQPVFADWGSMGTLFVADDDIVPDGIYEVQQIGLGCDRDLEESYSAPLSMATSGRWGDLVGENSISPPNDDTNFIDVSAVVDKFKQVIGAVGVEAADLQPSEPNGVIDFSDISVCLDAFRGFPYPYSGPEPCP